MVFSSVIFLFLYLPIVLSLYYFVPTRVKNLYLFIVSLVFYFWGEQFLFVILLFSSTLDYLCGISMKERKNQTGPQPLKRRLALIVSIAGNLGLLIYFKYAEFFVGILDDLISQMGHTPPSFSFWKEIHLPLGISFFTFQSMSYTIDVYRGVVQPTRSFVSFSCFVSLFPQLVAGPIVRYTDIAIQLNCRQVHMTNVASGIRRFIIGLGKKVLIANTVAEHADYVFGLDPENLSFGLAWYGAVCYALQIYFDFSGYSDMAIGLGRMFGFKFPENFNYPYIADSMRDFWRRWHMTLSTWFRDYLYIPLGGNQRSRFRTCLNLVLVFFLCGLWHGASWNFVIWGLFHGIFLMFERLVPIPTRKGFKILDHCYVWVVVLVGWVFFRCETLRQSTWYLLAMVGGGSGEDSLSLLLPNLKVALAFIAGVFGSSPIVPWTRSLRDAHTSSSSTSFAWSHVVYSTAGCIWLTIVLFFSVLSLAAQTHNPFIYFRF